MSTNEELPKPRKKLTSAQQAVIVAQVINGKSQTDVAKEFGVHRNTVYTLCKQVRQDKDMQRNPLAGDYRERLKSKAITAIEAGLDCKQDSYKRANVGARVMEGIGEFKVPGHGSVNVAIVAATPAEWRARYLSIDSEPTPQPDVVDRPIMVRSSVKPLEST